MEDTTKEVSCYKYEVLKNETLADMLHKNNDFEILDSQDLSGVEQTGNIKLYKFRCQCKKKVKDNLWFVIVRIKVNGNITVEAFWFK